ncbi:MAG: preprotein translocase subunit SecA [Myxococcota bacterium]|jgi:preprotein translocase subunit SecA|nr:preprotein translocase subunit SecA [Myxococcota bacterium]
MIQSLLRAIFGSKNDRELKRIVPLIERVNALEPAWVELSDAALAGKTAEFRQRLANGEALDALLPEAFATVREASKRTLGQRHYDVQLVGGAVLHEGKIAEMKTGEGKTLVATLPSYLNALPGKGVHVVTVNDYLARRDAEWMGQVHRFLGLTVGVIVHDLSDAQRQAAYGADITYGTNNEYGFDYLRDNMKRALFHCVQRELHYAIVDEVDSILIDEARTPLIISGPSEENTQVYGVADRVVRQLRAGTKGDVNKGIEETGEFWFDEKDHVAALTDEGVHRVEKLLGIQNLYDPQMLPVNHAVNQALIAHALKKRDVDYVVKAGEDGKPEVLIVDEFTGRLMPGRRWSDGLHQAVEAKEGIQVQSENQTLATITYQNYFRMYEKLSGMTGTADTEAPEFAKIYDLEVLVIPTNRPMVRQDLGDVVYKTKREKFDAVVEDIKARHAKGQPILVGTIAIETSEMFAAKLKRAGVKHAVLNAKQHEREAEIVAQAGAKGAVTISTNMAGRGTDILLGGNPEYLALAKCGHDREHPDFVQWQSHFEAACAKERDEVVAAGGLHIIGTERHESRRIDNQLRGRAGRQGDPGSSHFYLSLEDDLLRLFGSDRIAGWMERLGLEEGEAIEHRWITRAIENAQRKVEARNFDIRKNLLEYDDVMNKQRQAFYGRRAKVLASEEVHDEVLEMVEGVLVGLIDTHWPPKGDPDPEQIAALVRAIEVGFGVRLDVTQPPFDQRVLEKDAVGRALLERLMAVLDEKERRWDALREQYPQVNLITHRQLERDVVLRTLDRLWKEHLHAMDALRDGIRFRGYAQRDPKVEYAREGFGLFDEMQGRVDSQSAEEIFKVWIDESRLADAARQIAAQAAPTPSQAPAQAASAPQAASPRPAGGPILGPASRPGADAPGTGKVGRNDLCTCGSGKKFKRCCGA